MSLDSQFFKRPLSHNRVRQVKLDRIPGYDIEEAKEDVNHSNKQHLSKHQTRSASFRVKQIQNYQSSSQSETVKKVRAQLDKAQMELEQATMDYKRKNQQYDKGVAEQSPNLGFYTTMVQISAQRQQDLRELVQKRRYELAQLLNEKIF